MESRIVELLENQLPRAERAGVEMHLAECVRCRAFSRQLAGLEAALARSIKAPKLNPGFSARLKERVLVSETDCHDRKQQLQAEFETSLARLRKKALGLDNAWMIVRHAAFAAIGGWLILELALAPGGMAQAWVFGGLLAAAGVAAAFPEKLKRLWT
ncbi:MAG TPA: zf-HC2 domain-containing protein [Verrucomicrobiae bacterium]